MLATRHIIRLPSSCRVGVDGMFYFALDEFFFMLSWFFVCVIPLENAFFQTHLYITP